jgi:hypothetical protein
MILSVYSLSNQIHTVRSVILEHQNIEYPKNSLSLKINRDNTERFSVGFMSPLLEELLAPCQSELWSQIQIDLLPTRESEGSHWTYRG